MLGEEESEGREFSLDLIKIHYMHIGNLKQ